MSKVENMMGMSLDDIIKTTKKAAPKKKAGATDAKGAGKKKVADAAQQRAKAGRAAKLAAKRGQANTERNAKAAAGKAKVMSCSPCTQRTPHYYCLPGSNLPRKLTPPPPRRPLAAHEGQARRPQEEGGSCEGWQERREEGGRGRG